MTPDEMMYVIHELSDENAHLRRALTFATYAVETACTRYFDAEEHRTYWLSFVDRMRRSDMVRNRKGGDPHG